MHRTPLNDALERSFSFENEQCSAATTIETRAFDGLSDEQTRNADAAYRFGPDAWTTITVETDAYETYHTYPERDLTVYTRTRIISESTDDTDTIPSFDC